MFFNFKDDCTDDNFKVKERLNVALKTKLDELEVKKREELLVMKTQQKNSRMTKRKALEEFGQEHPHTDLQQFGESKKKKTFHEQEMDLHEAYQVLLAEYHRRVKQRMKKQMHKMHLVTKIAGPIVQSKSNEQCKAIYINIYIYLGIITEIFVVF